MPRVTITIPETSPQAYDFDLKQEVVTIGRRDDNDIVISCGSVSGKHAEMRRAKGFYHLVDTGSTNGLNINGTFQPTVALLTGMTIILGEVKFEFSLNEDELAALTSELIPTTAPVISADQEQAAKAEAAIAEAAIAEAAIAEAAIAEAAIAEAAIAEAAKAEAAKAEAAIAEAAKAEAAIAEAAIAEAAIAEAAKAEAAKAEAAIAEAAIAEAAIAEAAIAEAAKAELAKAELAKAELAKTEQAQAELAKAEQAKAEQAKAEKKERANKEAIAKKADKAEKRKRLVKPANSDEYFESKTLKIGSGVTLIVMIAIAAAFLYGGITHDRNGTGENSAKTTTDKDGVKNEAPKEVDDKPDDGAK